MVFCILMTKILKHGKIDLNSQKYAKEATAFKRVEELANLEYKKV